jgi:hypothetical protein
MLELRTEGIEGLHNQGAALAPLDEARIVRPAGLQMRRNRWAIRVARAVLSGIVIAGLASALFYLFCRFAYPLAARLF